MKKVRRGTRAASLERHWRASRQWHPRGHRHHERQSVRKEVRPGRTLHVWRVPARQEARAALQSFAPPGLFWVWVSLSHGLAPVATCRRPAGAGLASAQRDAYEVRIVHASEHGSASREPWHPRKRYSDNMNDAAGKRMMKVRRGTHAASLERHWRVRLRRTSGTRAGIEIMNGSLSAFSRQPSAFSPSGRRCPCGGLQPPASP